jgi:hypothetical protein
MYACEIAQTYLGRGHISVDVFAGSLTCFLDLLLFLVEHDLAGLDGTAFRQSELRPRDRTSFGDDLEEEAGLWNVSERTQWILQSLKHLPSQCRSNPSERKTPF